MSIALLLLLSLLLSAQFKVHAAAMPRTAPELVNALADQAALNATAAAKSGRAQDAKTWSAWSRIYRQQSSLAPLQAMSALDLADAAAKSNAAEAATDEARGLTGAAAFLHATHDFWIGIAEQLRRGAALSIRFPEHAMLTPVNGLQGTPWNGPSSTASASDCAAIARKVRQCEADVAAGMHHDMLGLGEDQSDYVLVRRQQCNRWEEARLAYCGAH